MAIREKGSLATTVVVSRLPDVSGNYVCDGTADDVEINEALNYVNTLGGGRVVLKQGTYVLAAPITFPGNNIWLRGMGRPTFIDADGLPDAVGQHAIIISAKASCALKKLAIQTLDGSAHANPHHCVFVENASNNLTIHDITIVDSDSDGVHIEGTNVFDIHIRGLRVDDVDDYGIYVGMTAANWCSRLMIDGALVLGAGIIGIRLGRCQYSEISNSVCALGAQTGINLDVCNYCDISNCLSIANTQHGIIMAGAAHCLAEGCNCSLNGYHGIYLDESDECVVSGCVCSGNDSGDTTTYDGIYVDGDSTLNSIVDNHCCSNHRYGISVDGIQNAVVGNYVHSNDRHGIYVNAAECKVNENYATDNGVDTAGSYHGIDLSENADRCSVNGNYCSDTGGDIQSDGIHLEDGATQVQINDNYCYNGYHSAGAGNGITLTANNDNCLIADNYCYLNDGYGISIVAATCDKNIVRGNQLTGNVTGAILDSGTLTQVYDNNEGIAVTDVKVYRTMTNNTGGALAVGDVVILKGIAGDLEIDTTAVQGDDKVYGMVAEAIADAASGYVQVKGKTTALKVDGTVDVAIGDPLGTFTAVKIAMKAAAGDMAFAIALEGYTDDDSDGVIDAYIKSPWD